MTKNHFIAIVVILAVGSVIYFSFFSKNKTSPTGETMPEEIFSLSGTVSGVDAGNNFLTVKSAERELKVIISENTQLINLAAPFNSKNPPKPGTQFTPKETEVTLGDFKVGDEVFVKTKENIAGKTELDSVELIQILP